MLQAKGYEAFLPTYRHRVKYNKNFDLPLFPSYVFCRIELSSRLPVITTPGVFSIVGNRPEPEPISEQEAEGVRRMLESGFMPIPGLIWCPDRWSHSSPVHCGVFRAWSSAQAMGNGWSFRSICFGALSL